jgi:hypothetical protein
VKKKDIVLLSTAEWDNPFWTNKQHVAVELAKRGHRVFYIDSLGLRRPSMTGQDIKRIIKRLKKALQPPKMVKSNLWVWSPILIPSKNNQYIVRLNYIILNSWLNFWLRRLDFKKDIFWTYSPLTTELFDTKDYKQLIYHCVDEIKAQPGMPVKALEEAEKELSKRADLIFTTSKKLYETRKEYNKNTYYFSNVADFDHFNRALEPNLEIPKELLDIPSPRIGFIGALSGYKIDFKLIEFLAKRYPTYSFILIGKVGEGDPWTDINNLKGLKNIYFLGSKPYSELPKYLKGIDVAILPNQINEYTDSMFPMKFFEYLSAGKPIVSVNLLAIQEYQEICYLSKDYDEFAKNLEKALNDSDDKLNKRLTIAKRFTYKSRTDKMMKIVEEEGENL